MMRRSTPFDFEEMFDRMNRQLEEMNRQFEHSGLGGIRNMAVDVAEHDDDVVVTADLPGYEKSDIGISVSGDVLTIRAEREASSDREDGAYVRRERRTEAARRTVSLPAEVDEEAGSATYRNGVLTVTLPKLDVDSDDSHAIDIE
jgi:HSP20 family protein